MTSRRRSIAWGSLLGFVLFSVLAAAGILWHEVSRFADAPMAIQPQTPPLEVARGSSFNTIVQRVRERRLSGAPRLYWRLLALRMGVTDKLHAGEYALRPGLAPRHLLDKMAHGKVMQRDFTLVDGWTFDQVRAALAKAPVLKHDIAGMDGAAVMRRIGVPGVSPEGQFLPETYAYVKGDTDLSILKRAHRAMLETLQSMWPGRNPDIPLDTPQQALILASIVEKETARADERPRIAGVFERRLKKGMMLQTDPAVIYGLGKRYNGDITNKDLVTDTPYNTYMHTGLPPTPIAMPGRPAIQAVLHPAKGSALYFVAKGDGSGSHVFSNTLAEHDRAVACYQLHRCRGKKH